MRDFYEDYEYNYKLSIHDVQLELEAYARQEKRRSQNTKPMGKWTTDAYGTAECRTCSFATIFEAYQEYKDTCWSKMYDNY